MVAALGKTDWYQDEHIDKLLDFHLGKQLNLYIFSPLSATNYNKKEGTFNNLHDVFAEYDWQRAKGGVPKDERVILPVLIGENHWVLLSINYAANSNNPASINYFDPLGGSVSKEVSQAFNQIFRESPVVITNISKRVQYDGYNCSAWVVEAARSLVERNELHELPTRCDIAEMRAAHNRVLTTNNPKIEEVQQPTIRQQGDVKKAGIKQAEQPVTDEEAIIVPHSKSKKAPPIEKPTERCESKPDESKKPIIFSFNPLYESAEIAKSFQKHDLTDRQRYEHAYEQLNRESLPHLAVRYHQWASKSDYLPGRITAFLDEQRQHGKDGAYLVEFLFQGKKEEGAYHIAAHELGKNSPEKLQTLRQELVHMLARECSINPTHYAQLNEQPQVTSKIKSRM